MLKSLRPCNAPWPKKQRLCEKNDPATIAQRAPITIDRDNFDDVLERSNVHLNKTLLTGEGDGGPAQHEEGKALPEELSVLLGEIRDGETADIAIRSARPGPETAATLLQPRHPGRPIQSTHTVHGTS